MRMAQQRQRNTSVWQPFKSLQKKWGIPPLVKQINLTKTFLLRYQKRIQDYQQAARIVMMAAPFVKTVPDVHQLRKRRRKRYLEMNPWTLVEGPSGRSLTTTVPPRNSSLTAWMKRRGPVGGPGLSVSAN